MARYKIRYTSKTSGEERERLVEASSVAQIKSHAQAQGIQLTAIEALRESSEAGAATADESERGVNTKLIAACVAVAIIVCSAFVYWAFEIADLDGSKPENLANSSLTSSQQSAGGSSLTSQADNANRSGATSEIARPMTFEEVVEKASDSVGVVRTSGNSGSAFAISDQVVFTNHHVVSHSFLDEVFLRFPSQDSAPVQPDALLHFDAKRDVAVLRCLTKAPGLKFTEDQRLRPGAEVIVIGSPSTGSEQVLENAVSLGVMSTTTTMQGHAWYQISVSINPGNSGGPILLRDGRVAAMATLKASNEEGVAFGVPGDEMAAIAANTEALTETDIRRNGDIHAAQVSFRKMDMAAELFLYGMDTNIDMMQLSIDGGGSSSEGLASIADSIAELVSNTDDSLDERRVKRELQRLQSSPYISDSAKSDLIEFWTIVSTARSYLDTPRGSLVSYREKFDELSDNRDTINEKLQIALGVESIFE